MTYAFFALGLLAASQSGNIIRIGDASPVAIAAWRLLLAALFLFPLAWRAGGLGRLGRRTYFLLGITGVILALHFLTWISAVQQTSVGNATLLLAVSPIVAAIGGRSLLAERVGWRLVVSIALAIVGIATVSGGDLQIAKEHVRGDLLAVLSATLFAAYTLLGRYLRPMVPSQTYVVAIYAVAASVCFALLFASGLPVVAYDERNWLCFLLMALVPTCIGHTAINHALRYIPATRVNVLILTEPIFAALVASWVWDEPITRSMLLGYVIIGVSVSILFLRFHPSARVRT